MASGLHVLKSRNYSHRLLSEFIAHSEPQMYCLVGLAAGIWKLAKQTSCVL